MRCHCLSRSALGVHPRLPLPRRAGTPASATRRSELPRHCPAPRRVQLLAAPPPPNPPPLARSAGGRPLARSLVCAGPAPQVAHRARCVGDLRSSRPPWPACARPHLAQPLPRPCRRRCSLAQRQTAPLAAGDTPHTGSRPPRGVRTHGPAICLRLHPASTLGPPRFPADATTPRARRTRSAASNCTRRKTAHAAQGPGETCRPAQTPRPRPQPCPCAWGRGWAAEA